MSDTGNRWNLIRSLASCAKSGALRALRPRRSQAALTSSRPCSFLVLLQPDVLVTVLFSGAAAAGRDGAPCLATWAAIRPEYGGSEPPRREIAHVEKRADERARPTAGAKPSTASKHATIRVTLAMATENEAHELQLQDVAPIVELEGKVPPRSCGLGDDGIQRSAFIPCTSLMQ